MVHKRFFAALCIALALCSLTAFAIPEAEPCDSCDPQISAAGKEDWRAKAEAANAKWKKLPENQRKEVYALLEQKAADEIRLMEKYRELGIIDESVLERFRAMTRSKIDAIKDSGEFPLFAEKNFRHGNVPKEKKTF